MSDTVYPQPDKVYVKKGRCIYCGSKKIKTLYGYEWCDKPCKMGAQVLDIYEREHHLGPYAPKPAPEPETEESE